jgi:hypothetical protein
MLLHLMVLLVFIVLLIVAYMNLLMVNGLFIYSTQMILSVLVIKFMVQFGMTMQNTVMPIQSKQDA